MMHMGRLEKAQPALSQVEHVAIPEALHRASVVPARKIHNCPDGATAKYRLRRFYDELGLLSPTFTDPQTGYRYYSAE
jgi:hypothetical protein